MQLEETIFVLSVVAVGHVCLVNLCDAQHKQDLVYAKSLKTSLGRCRYWNGVAYNLSSAILRNLLVGLHLTQAMPHSVHFESPLSKMITCNGARMEQATKQGDSKTAGFAVACAPERDVDVKAT